MGGMNDMSDLRTSSDAATLISRADPEPVREHWVEVDGTLYPPKQAYHLLTGLPRSDYNTHHALSQLRRHGFATSTYTPGAPPKISEPPKKTVRKSSPKTSTARKRTSTPVHETPGTWRVADGSAVPFSEALAVWADEAHKILEATARRYNDFVTYKELSEKVQDVSGIRTRMHMRNWIGRVLAAVVDECTNRHEPPLRALCVTQNHTVGEGYRYVLEKNGEPLPDDLDLHAAHARLLCYRAYATDLPADGGVATLPKQVATARANAARKAAAARPERIELCPVHYTALPQSGRCDYCG